MTAHTELLPCPFCGKTVMLRGALWPAEGDRDAVIHAGPTDCPLYDFANDTFDGSIVEVWNRRAALSDQAARIAELLAADEVRVRDISRLTVERDASRAECEGLRAALEFYADISKYPAPFTGGFGELYFDCGQIARAALSRKETGDAT